MPMPKCWGLDYNSRSAAAPSAVPPPGCGTPPSHCVWAVWEAGGAQHGRQMAVAVLVDPASSVAGGPPVGVGVVVGVADR